MLLDSSAGTLNASLPSTSTAPRKMTKGFWLPCRVYSALRARLIVTSHSRAVLTCVPPPATPPRPSSVRQAPNGVSAEVAGVGAAAATEDGHASPLADHMISDDSALPLIVSSDTHAPG